MLQRFYICYVDQIEDSVLSADFITISVSAVSLQST